MKECMSSGEAGRLRFRPGNVVLRKDEICRIIHVGAGLSRPKRCFGERAGELVNPRRIARLQGLAALVHSVLSIALPVQCQALNFAVGSSPRNSNWLASMITCRAGSTVPWQ
jgi:hypothetical protein